MAGPPGGGAGAGGGTEMRLHEEKIWLNEQGCYCLERPGRGVAGGVGDTRGPGGYQEARARAREVAPAGTSPGGTQG